MEAQELLFWAGEEKMAPQELREGGK